MSCAILGPMRRLALVVALTSAGCGGDITSVSGADVLAPPRFEETCGVEGPVELLALDPGEHAFRLDWDPSGERVLVGVFRVSGPLSVQLDTSDRAIVSVPPCGGESAMVAEGMEYKTSYDGLTLACSVDGDALYRVDPLGVEPPALVLDGTCGVRRTDAGLVAVLAGSGSVGRLVIVRDPSNPVVETLVDGVGVPVNPFFGGDDYQTTPLWADGEQAIAMTPAGEVIEVNLVDGTTTVILDGVLDFRASGGGTKILWQADAPLAGEPETPVSPLFLYDRETTGGVGVLDTHLAWTASPFPSDWVVVRDDSSLGRRLFDHAGEELALPEDTFLRGVLGVDRFWLSRQVDETTQELYWEIGSEPRVVVEHVLGHPGKSGDGIKVYVEDDHPAMNEGALLYGSFDGGGPEVLSERVNFHHRRLPDGRLLGIVGEDNNAHGQLRLEDPASGSVVEIDRHGYLHSPSLNAGDPFEGDIVWAVDDPEDGRHAVFRGRISAGVEPQ